MSTSGVAGSRLAAWVSAWSALGFWPLMAKLEIYSKLQNIFSGSKKKDFYPLLDLRGLNWILKVLPSYLSWLDWFSVRSPPCVGMCCFEVLHNVDMKLVAMKMAFMLVRTSVRRMGELHDLVINPPACNDDWKQSSCEREWQVGEPANWPLQSSITIILQNIPFCVQYEAHSPIWTAWQLFIRWTIYSSVLLQKTYGVPMSKKRLAPWVTRGYPPPTVMLHSI